MQGVAQSEIEEKIQELFVDYINKARELFPEDTHESIVDSDIAIMSASLVDLFIREKR